MTLPNWLKIAYWIVLVVLVGWLLLDRLDITAPGNGTPFDAVVFVVWIALLLAPIFSEVKIWGISLKQEIEKVKQETEEAKDDILRELQSIRLDVRNSVHVAPVFNHMVQAPPPDSQLPAIRDDIERALPAVYITNAPEEHAALEVPKDAEFLFSTRYLVEKEIRRIGSAFFKEGSLRTQIRGQVDLLVKCEAIPYALGKAVINLYRICSPAVHGDPVTPEQFAFVQDVGPHLIEVLKKTPAILLD